MSGRALLIVAVAVLVLGAAACADVRDRMDDVRADAEQVTDTARFCLGVARAVAAIEAGSPRTAAEAAAEVLVHAPDDVRADARLVARAVQQAREGDRSAIEDPQFEAAVDRLQDRTREICDPTN